MDGEPLGPLLGRHGGNYNAAVDFVPVLVLDWPAGFPKVDYERLLGAASCPLPGGRVPLYVCAECGDLGCGGVTAVVELSPETVVWRDFGYQNDYEPFDELDVFVGVGPFVFNRDDYEQTLRQFPESWPRSPLGV